MRQDKIPWGEATPTQLKMFAAQVLGIMVAPNIGEQTLRAKIRTAFSGDTLTILVDESVEQPPRAEEPTPQPMPQPEAETPEPFAELSPAEPEGPSRRDFLIGAAATAGAATAVAAAAAASGGGKPMVGTSGEHDPKVLITIAEVEGPGGKRPVFTSVNGVAMLIPRGRAVPIPYRYFRCLLDAVKTVHHQDEDTGEIISSQVPSYPMSVNRMPPQADIDAYLALEQQVAA